MDNNISERLQRPHVKRERRQRRLFRWILMRFSSRSVHKKAEEPMETTTLAMPVMSVTSGRRFLFFTEATLWGDFHNSTEKKSSLLFIESWMKVQQPRLSRASQQRALIGHFVRQPASQHHRHHHDCRHQRAADDNDWVRSANNRQPADRRRTDQQHIILIEWFSGHSWLDLNQIKTVKILFIYYILACKSEWNIFIWNTPMAAGAAGECRSRAEGCRAAMVSRNWIIYVGCCKCFHFLSIKFSMVFG